MMVPSRINKLNIRFTDSLSHGVSFNLSMQRVDVVDFVKNSN